MLVTHLPTPNHFESLIQANLFFLVSSQRFLISSTFFRKAKLGSLATESTYKKRSQLYLVLEIEREREQPISSGFSQSCHFSFFGSFLGSNNVQTVKMVPWGTHCCSRIWSEKNSLLSSYQDLWSTYEQIYIQWCSPVE